MAGPGVYPPDAYSTVKDFLPSNPHFDLAIAPAVLPRMTETPLIQHFWGKPDLAPTFKNGQHAESDAENLLPLSFIRPTTAIFHRNSDGTLIECLRQARAPIPCSPVAPEPDSVQDPLAEVADLPGELKINVAVPAAKPMKYKMK